MKTSKETTVKKAAKVVVREVGIDELRGHPLNRSFATRGRVWEEFLGSLRQAGGVLVRLLVREVPGVAGYEILAGHRRWSGAGEVGFSMVPCEVVALDDEAALEFLINENMQREDLTPVEEARFVRALSVGRTAEEVAVRVSRSVEWVRTRQQLLDLGDEVCRRVALGRGEAGHVTLGAISAILEVPEDLRPQAVQMVLHPELEEEALNERQAREVLRKCLVEPHAEAAEWGERRDAVAKEWRRVLKATLEGLRGKGGAEGLLVQAVGWEEREGARRGGVAALVAVDDVELYAAAPSGLLWVELAIRHGVAVRVFPLEGVESEALVDAGLLRQAEAAREEHGAEPWLRKKKPALGVVTRMDDGGKQVTRALADCDGEADPEHVEKEEVETVVEQRMEHHAMIDMGAVARLREWALLAPADQPAPTPEWVPEWARDLYVEDVSAACEWVISLKK